MSAMRAGYKQTEVGVIPEDWDVRPLGTLVTTLEAGVSVNSLDADMDGSTHDLSILKTSCVFGGKFIPEERKPIVARDIHRAKLNPRKDTIVFSRMNTPALVGECGYIDRDYSNLFLPDRLWMTRHDIRIPHCVRWLAFLLSSSAFNRAIKESATGTSGSMKNISKGSLLAVPIPFPPTKAEQEAIAETLSDADALIESLEQLLAKKRHLKLAAMQELLTGKERLPGFSGEWGLRTLDSVVDALEAGVSVNSLDSLPHIGEPSILKTSAMADGRFMPIECKAIAPFDISRARANPRRNSILISRMNTPDLVGEVGYVDDDYPWLFLPDRIWMTRFRVGSEICVRWLAYLLSSAEYKRLMQGAATGTSGSMKNISKPALMALPIRFPSYTEQTAIAAVLSDIDAEIAELESQLAKTRALKQGMMQKLLTGEIRLL